MSGYTEGYCLKDIHCGLCRFPFEDEDTVNIVYPQGHLSVAFSFVHGRNQTFEAPHQYPVHLCGKRLCEYYDFRARAIHQSCGRLRREPVLRELLASTDLSFTPSVGRQVERRTTLRNELSALFKSGLLRKLPTELCLQIAGELVLPFATVTYPEINAGGDGEANPKDDTAADSAPGVHDSVVSTSEDIFAQFIKIEGITYLRNLYNASSPRSQVGPHVCIFRAPQRANHSIYWAWDPLGVRAVIFSTKREVKKESAVSDLWWTSASLQGGESRIHFSKDGLKIRSIEPPSECPRLFSVQTLPILGLPFNVINLDTGAITRASQHYRMNLLECNKRGTTGYLVAFYGGHFAGLYAAHPGLEAKFQSDVSFLPVNTVWIHMPLEPTESLQDLLVVRSRHKRALICLTDRQRPAYLGPYIPERIAQIQPLRINKDGLSPVYFSTWDVGHESTDTQIIGPCHNDGGNPGSRSTTSHHDLIQSLRPTSSPPPSLRTESWFYSECSLEDVAGVSCCVERDLPHHPIIGMSVSYKDGRQVVVGQYRPDWVLEPKLVAQHLQLHIKLARTDRGFPYVADVDLTSVGSRLPWEGKLIWWFTSRESHVSHIFGK